MSANVEAGVAVLEPAGLSGYEGELGLIAEPAIVAPSLLSEEHISQLESRALNGTVFIAFTTVASVVLRLVNSIVFSHLFVPEYFGLMALVTTIIIGVALF